MSASTTTSAIFRDSCATLVNIPDFNYDDMESFMLKKKDITLADLDLIIKQDLLEQDIAKRQAKSRLPDNPITYDSSQTRIWISQFLESVEVPDAEAGEIMNRLYSIYGTFNGATLYQWDVKTWQQYFGMIGDIMCREFRLKVEHFQNNKRSSQLHLERQQQRHDPSGHVPCLLDPPFTATESQLLQHRIGLNNGNADLNHIFFSPSFADHLVPPDEIIPSPLHCYNPNEQDCSFYPHPPPNYFSFHQGIDTEAGAACIPDEVCPWIKSDRPSSIGDSDTLSESGSVTLEMGSEFESKQTLPGINTLFRTHPYTHPIGVVTPIMQEQKRGRGRPRKIKEIKPKRIQPILYKFILMHLNGKFGPESRKWLEWVDKSEGIFRFHSAQKDAFAVEWGKYKRNREPMTYQNMARALRNYTKGKKKIMERVKRKLHYKFVDGISLS